MLRIQWMCSAEDPRVRWGSYYAAAKDIYARGGIGPFFRGLPGRYVRSMCWLGFECRYSSTHKHSRCTCTYVNCNNGSMLRSIFNPDCNHYVGIRKRPSAIIILKSHWRSARSSVFSFALLVPTSTLGQCFCAQRRHFQISPCQ